MKRKRRITSAELGATEFISVDFAQSSDKLQQYLVTLTNKCEDSLYKVVIWLWDKQYKMVSWAAIKLDSNLGVNEEQVPSQVSFNPEDPRFFVVTGNNIYRYFKVTQSLQLVETVTQLVKKDLKVGSMNLVGHIWVEKRIVICS
jgi:hypothetical protein